jgi:hypothetical protein
MRQIAFPEPAWGATEVPAFPRKPMPHWGFVELFVIGQTVLPALLYFSVFQPLRLPIRIGAFLASVLALAVARWGMKGVRHPSIPWLLCSLAYLLLMIFHPNTNTYLAGCAQVILYLAVLAPVFWTPALVRSAAHLRRLLWLLLILNGINAGVGVLQVYAPGTWMPKEITAVDWSGVVQIRTVATTGAKVLSYKGVNGEKVIRPTGLFDSPGAVAGPGMFAGLIGLAFFASVSGFLKKAVALILSLMGVSVIYLTQVRTSLVLLVGMLLVYLWSLIFHRKISQATSLLVVAITLTVSAFSLALFLGGGGIRDRFATLWSRNPAEVYYASRGSQLENGFTQLLAEHPFGAGLARYGMMRHYFGNQSNLDSTQIWAEVQFPAWILDGGFVLTFFYTVGMIVSLVEALRVVSRGRSEELRSIAALVLAVNAGTAALTLSFTPFITQVGLQYWLLCGALHGAAEGEAQRAGKGENDSQ